MTSLGCFSYIDAVLRLFNLNDRGWFNDEIFAFFEKILNLHQEYCPTTKALHVQVPQVIFCNSFDDSSKINSMYKTHHYSIINNLLKKDFVGPDKEKIESENKQWYQCNENTQLDHVLTRFDRINKTVSKLCVPLHGGAHWSVLDIVVLPETGSTNGYIKKTDYIKPNNNKSSSTINVTCSPTWWANYFGLYAKDKNGVSHSNIYFGLDDMTLGKNKQSQEINSSLDILKGD